MSHDDIPRRKKDTLATLSARKPSDEDTPLPATPPHKGHKEIDDRPLTEEERGALIDQFEGLGAITLDIETDGVFYQALMEYVRHHNIPINISIDKRAGQMTIASRPMGTLELG